MSSPKLMTCSSTKLSMQALQRRICSCQRQHTCLKEAGQVMIAVWSPSEDPQEEVDLLSRSSQCCIWRLYGVAECLKGTFEGENSFWTSGPA